MPPETQGIVVIDGHRCESTWYANVVRVARYGADFNVIQDAIDYAVSQTPTAASPWIVEIYAGTYDEALIMGDHVNLVGIGERGVILIQTGAGDIITVGNVHCHIENLRLDHSGGGTGACTAVTNAGSDILLEYCHILGMPAPVHVIEMTAGELRLHSCEVVAGDIDLSTAACTFVAHYTMIENGDIDLSGAFDHVLELHYIDMHGGDIANAAAGAVDIDLRYCSDIGTFTDAGLVGTVIIEYSVITSATKSGTSPWVSRLSDLFILSNTNATGAITCYAGLIYSITRAEGPIVWWWDKNTLKVIPCVTTTDTIIQWAVNAAGAGDTILLAAGTYTETVTFDAAADVVTLRGAVQDKVIVTMAADTVLYIHDIENVCIENLTVNLTAGNGDSAVDVYAENADAIAILRNVTINVTGTGATTNNGIYTRTGGVVKGWVECYNVKVIASNTVAGASTTRCLYSRGEGNEVLDDVHFEATDTNGTAIALYLDQGRILSYESYYTAAGTTPYVVQLTSNAASILQCYNDTIIGGTIVKGANGVMTYKNAPQQYEVWAGMEVQDAITAAAADTPAPAATAPYAILIHPGIYDEAVTCSDYVHLKGIGPRGSVVISQDDADPLTVADADVSDLTVRIVAPSVERHHVVDGGTAAVCRLYNLVFEVTTPLAWRIFVFYPTSAASEFTIEGCYYNIGGTGASQGVRLAAAATIHFINNDFNFTNVNAVFIFGNAASDVTGGGNRWAGTCHMWNVTNGTILFNNDSITTQGDAWGDITGGSVCMKNVRQQYEVVWPMLIQHAITAAAADTPAPAATAPYTVLIHPGIYDEQITCSTYVNLKGIGPKGSVVIYQNTLNVMYLATQIQVQDLTLRLGTLASERYHCLDNTVICVVRFDNVVFEITAPGTEIYYLFYLRGNGSYLTLERCSCNIGGTGVAAVITNITAAASGHLVNNDFTLDNANAFMFNNGMDGTWTGCGNRWAGTCGWVTSNNGTFIFNNDSVVCTGANVITGGSVCLKNGRHQYEVYEGMFIQDAIGAAAADTPAPAATAPYTILIHSGIYDATVTMSSWVNLKGGGSKGSVVLQRTDAAPVITLASNTEIENLAVRLVTPGVARQMIIDGGAALTGVKLIDITLEITTPLNLGHEMIYLNGGSIVTLEKCTSNIVGGGGGLALLYLGTNASTVLVDRCTCNLTNGSIIVCSGGSTVSVIDSILRGTAIHLVSPAGAIRVMNSQYRSISRTGTGNIVDESPYLSDAPWKVHKWHWMTALASVDIAVRGTPVDAGSGQVLLEVNTGGADFEAVETNTEVAGSLGNEFTPARTPRFITQIAVDAFHADARMFFGLRETLGNAVPDITGAGEQCAGFDWTGGNFRAISTNGAAAGVFTNLTTPTVDVQVQLEVIVIGGVQVDFYVDGLLVATHDTAAGIPTAALDWQHLLESPGVGAPADIDVTVRTGGCQECPA